MSDIILFPVGKIDTAIVEFLVFALPENLGIPCALSEKNISTDNMFDPVREQYHSTQLLERLLENRAGKDTKLLGVSDVDLFIPPLSFVFGEAQFDNPAAIISVHRLHQQFYGLPEDVSLLYLRSEKEALHELGHCFGLIHCRDYKCVMHLSYAVEDIDLKTNSFCANCLNLLQEKL